MITSLTILRALNTMVPGVKVAGHIHMKLSAEPKILTLLLLLLHQKKLHINKPALFCTFQFNGNTSDKTLVHN